MDEFFILTNVYLTDPLQKLELTLNKLNGEGLTCKIEKKFLGKTEMEYLGFGVTSNCVKPMNNKMEAIINMKPPTYQKEARKFIGAINYH